MSVLKRCLDAEFGLLDECIDSGVLSHDVSKAIQAGKTIAERNERFLEWISENCKHYVTFLELLTRTSQEHVSNYLTNNGGIHSVIKLSSHSIVNFLN